MFCCISNQIPQEPVVNKENGCLYEKRLVELYVKEHGKCPSTGDPMTLDSLIAVRPAVPATTLSSRMGLGAASVPGLLERLHSEWDSVMLEQFTLRQRVAQMEQELAHALQQYEAACVVIANQQREMEELRAGVSQHLVEGEEAEGERRALPLVVTSAIDGAERATREERKKRAKTASAAPKHLTPSQRFTVSGGTLQCVRMGEKIVYTAGAADQFAVTPYSTTNEQLGAAGRGHSDLIHSLSLTKNEEVLASSSNDHTVKLWRPAESATSLVCTDTIRFPKGVVGQSSLIAADRFLLNASHDGCLYISDLDRGQLLSSTGSLVEGPVSAVEFHPYTSLAGVTTSNGVLSMIDVRQMAEDSRVHPKGVNLQYLSFGLDCVSVVTGLQDGRALLWDLRKLEAPVHTIDLHRPSPALVAFSPHSPDTVAVGAGDTLRLYHVSRLGASEGEEGEGSSVQLEGGLLSGLDWSTPSRIAACSLNGVVQLYCPS